MSLKIGITGGIGSGKTIVSKFFETQGYSVFYADLIAKQLLSDDSNIQSKIIAAFGKDAYCSGLPNKEFLAKTVFSNSDKLALINSILHSPTIARIKKLCETELLNKDLVFVEAALIYEAGMQDIFDYILVVTAEEKLRISRIAERDNSNEKDIRRRMDNQISEENKIALADFVIYNNGTKDELENKANLFLTIFKSLTKKN